MRDEKGRDRIRKEEKLEWERKVGKNENEEKILKRSDEEVNKWFGRKVKRLINIVKRRRNESLFKKLMNEKKKIVMIKGKNEI